jgi:hypothetical protein
MAGRDETVHVLERAEDRIDVAVVGDVVAEVGHRRPVDRRQPHRVDPEPRQVIDVPADAVDVTDAVAVRVRERSRVDLVDDAATPPGQRLGSAQGPTVARTPAVPSG